MKRAGIFMVLFAALLVAAAVLSISRLDLSGGKTVREPETTASAAPENKSPAPTPDTTPEATPSPEVTSTPVPENTPAPTPAPVSTPTPTPAPTPTPTPAPVTAAGSFRSDTGTGLNLVVSWETDGTQLKIRMSAESYSLFTSAAAGAMTLNINGTEYYLNVPAISYDGSGMTTTPLCSKTVAISAPSGVSITASWNYRGSYGGTALDTIVAADNIYVG